MRNIIAVFGFFTFVISGAFAVSAGSTNNTNTLVSSARAATNTGTRGQQAAVNAYKNSQKSNYYIYSQLDVDSACRNKIYNCLAEYCGDVTVVPGQRSGRCMYSTETELYNYSLLCLQKDTDVLLPQYGVNTRDGSGGMNTAARLCPSYVQQELMSYLSMANMADQLSKSHSSLCLQRRQELEAATSCYSVAMAYSNETSSMLTSQLTDYCGAGVPGGSSEMVARFANAGNVGANVWGWADKIVNLDLNKKGEDWQVSVNAILASYTNRMNLACGDNQTAQLATVTIDNEPTTLQKTAMMAGTSLIKESKKEENSVSTSFPTAFGDASDTSIWKRVQSAIDIYDYNTAKQVVQAGLTNSVTTPNPFLTSAQMDDMQNVYKAGTKIFIISDGSRCYTIQVGELSGTQKSLVAQSFANCINQ